MPPAPPDVAAQLDTLRALLDRHVRPCPFRFGDLVTPRGSGQMGFGRPHAVLAARPSMSGVDDIRVASVEDDGTILSLWASSARFEPWAGEGVGIATVNPPELRR